MKKKMPFKFGECEANYTSHFVGGSLILEEIGNHYYLALKPRNIYTPPDRPINLIVPSKEYIHKFSKSYILNIPVIRTVMSLPFRDREKRFFNTVDGYSERVSSIVKIHNVE